MQPQLPCTAHQANPIEFVCIDKQCPQSSRLFCKDCLALHQGHQPLQLNLFKKKYEDCRSLSNNGCTLVKKNFKRIVQTFELCIAKAEKKILQMYIPCVGSEPLPSLDSIEIQQLYGLVPEICKGTAFMSLLGNESDIGSAMKQQGEFLESMQNYFEQLNLNVMSSINKMMMQVSALKKKQDSNYSQIKSKLVEEIENKFTFSPTFKPQNFQIAEEGKFVLRKGTANESLSMYSIVDQPMTKQNNSISFEIVNQKNRFIYVGVCNKEIFKKYNFMGPVYEKGKMMYAIRQSNAVNMNAVCLHNSNNNFSNLAKVPWDFKVGDVITIEYNPAGMNLVFLKNSKQRFEMPVDFDINFPMYPFVGLKFEGDSVRIVNSLEKGGMVSKFFSKLIK